MSGQKTRLDHEDGPRGGRVFIGIRLRASGIAWLDMVADETGYHRAGVIRACIALGRAHKKELLTIIRDAKDTP
jgi:hypothetical protein